MTFKFNQKKHNKCIQKHSYEEIRTTKKKSVQFFYYAYFSILLAICMLSVISPMYLIFLSSNLWIELIINTSIICALFALSIYFKYLWKKRLCIEYKNREDEKLYTKDNFLIYSFSNDEGITTYSVCIAHIRTVIYNSRSKHITIIGDVEQTINGKDKTHIEECREFDLFNCYHKDIFKFLEGHSFGCVFKVI